MDDYREYCERPVTNKDSVTLNSYDTPWSHIKESDDSEDEEMLPTEEFWPIPEDDWTVVERSHRKPRGTNSSNRGRAHIPSGKLDNKGLRHDELDNIIDTKVLSSYRKEAARIADTFPKIGTEIETVIVNVKPIVGKQPDRIGAVSIDITDGRDNCPVKVVVTPQGRECQNHGIRTQAGELFTERPEVIPNEMAEEVTTGDLADRCELIPKTTTMKATTKDDVVIRPAPRQVRVEVLEETRTNENTVEECTY